MAGKSTLKDWKRAIRMNGIMLRLVYTEKKEFSFWGDNWEGGAQSLRHGCVAAERADAPRNVCLSNSRAPNVICPMALLYPCT